MTGVKFLFRVTLRRHDLAAEIYHLKEPQKLPLTMSPNEAERLRDDLRDYVMLSLGYGCGLRVGEIVRLKARSIDSVQMIIRIVQSKGRKNRNVMLPPDLLVSLREWWKVRPTRFDTDVPVRERWLFPGRRKGEHLAYRRIFHAAAAAAGITKRVSLHSLRHSLATDLLEKGINIRCIQGTSTVSEPPKSPMQTQRYSDGSQRSGKRSRPLAQHRDGGSRHEPASQKTHE